MGGLTAESVLGCSERIVTSGTWHMDREFASLRRRIPDGGSFYTDIPNNPNGPLAVEQSTCVSPTSVCWETVARRCLVLRSCPVRTGSKASRAGF